ncbi:MAG: MarR family transcriptional regulator [Hyphomicrobiaceae bacterium]|nr:MAG: MarR family transcriptional regulator [Hyphomicrobiaceae bacterium]
MSTSAVAAPKLVPQEDNGFKSDYLQALRLIERLHRLLLDVIKDEFDRLGRADLNSVQALLIYNIGDAELTAGELKTRGYYLGSNVSYNLKKLVETGYIHHKRSETDRRSVRISLTDKGQDAYDIVNRLYLRQLGSIEAVGEVGRQDFQSLNRALLRLERFWSDQIRFRL